MHIKGGDGDLLFSPADASKSVHVSLMSMKYLDALNWCLELAVKFMALHRSLVPGWLRLAAILAPAPSRPAELRLVHFLVWFTLVDTRQQCSRVRIRGRGVSDFVCFTVIVVEDVKVEE